VRPPPASRRTREGFVDRRGFPEQTVYAAEVDDRADSAERPLSKLTPAEALGEWLQQLVGYGTAQRGMAAALRAVLAVHAQRFIGARCAER